MTKVIGRLSQIGIGAESTRGTSVASDYTVPVTNIDFDDKVEYADNDSGFGRIEEKNDAAVIKRWAEGQYEGKIFDQSVGLELMALFGASPSSAQRTTTGVYDHTFTLAQNNQHKSLTLSYEDANLDLRYAMAMLNTWSLELAVDNYARRTANFVSKKSASASNSMSYVNENEFIPKDITFKVATDLAGLDGASAIKIRSFNMEVNKNVEALYVLGSNEPDDIANKQFAVTGSFEAYFNETTYRDFVLNGSQKALRIDIVSSTIIGNSGTHTPALRFDLAKAKFGEFERGWDSNDIMLQTINFEALFSVADSSMITARLTNAIDGTIYA